MLLGLYKFDESTKLLANMNWNFSKPRLMVRPEYITSQILCLCLERGKRDRKFLAKAKKSLNKELDLSKFIHR